MVGVGIARWGWMHALVGLLAVIVPGSVAVAQVVDTSPGHVVVMREKADLRCGETYYKVMEVKAGTLLVIDGSSAEWARVSYPPAGTAFVQAEHVRYDASASTATVTEPTRLRAANFTTGFRGSWKSLLATPLPLGTVLKVTEPAADEDGRVLAYRVVVPAAARGFMRREDLRQATAEEVAAARRSSDGVVEAPRPGRTDPAPAPVPVPVPSPAEDSTAVPVDRSTDSARPTLLDPMTPPGQEPPADVA
ncbi:MAG TPA: hypothetical protein PKU91_00225, partial [Phycisphaerales bacterium]|nr:hypothetical protein [Phycisphaerales bacterium]